jgi:hypothetical protein
MQHIALSLAGLAAVGLLAASAADAQLVVMPGETGAPLTQPALILPPSYGAYALQTVYPVCEVRRIQVQDAYGWRVRDVRVCY